MKTTAQKIKEIGDYGDSIIKANKLWIEKHDDFINKITIMVFGDLSKIIFCGETFEKHLVN